MTGLPDPKPERRIVDRSATTRKVLADPECRACERAASNGHHLLPKGEGGDDVIDNVIPLCGSGSDGCHGALHGNPYVYTPPPVPVFSRGSIAAVGQEQPLSERRDAEWVRRRIGARLRPEEIGYVARKLGLGPSREYLRRAYYVDCPA